MSADSKKENVRKPTRYDGKKALIVGDHPHVDSVAVCQGLESTLAGLGLVFKNIETDNEFFVFNPVNVKWL